MYELITKSKVLSTMYITLQEESHMVNSYLFLVKYPIYYEKKSGIILDGF